MEKSSTKPELSGTLHWFNFEESAMSVVQRRLLPEAPASEAGGPLRDVRILVVDDNEDARQLIAFILENFGARVTQAESVTLALQAIHAADFSVLISDIAMPERDGYDLIRCLREGATPTSRYLPAVAVTAFTGAEERARALAAGFAAHVPKPFNIQSLVQLVAELAQSWCPTLASQAAHPRPAR